MGTSLALHVLRVICSLVCLEIRDNLRSIISLNGLYCDERCCKLKQVIGSLIYVVLVSALSRPKSADMAIKTSRSQFYKSFTLVIYKCSYCFQLGKQ